MTSVLQLPHPPSPTWRINVWLGQGAPIVEALRWHTTLGRTPLDDWSAQRRDLCLTAHNNHETQTIHAHGGIRTRNHSKRAVADEVISLNFTALSCGMGYAVAQLAEALSGKPGVRWFDSRWCRSFSLILSFQPHYTPGVDSGPNRNEYQYIFWGKGGRCVGLTSLPPSCAEFLEIWEPQTPSTLVACPGL